MYVPLITADPHPSVPATLPPYALAVPTFRFRHLALLAGRAPIGGAREVALACFVVARLAAECERGAPIDEDSSERVARSAGARTWLASLSLPAAIKTPATLCAELSGAGTAEGVGQALRGLAHAASSYLDAASSGELEALAAALKR